MIRKELARRTAVREEDVKHDSSDKFALDLATGGPFGSRARRVRALVGAGALFLASGTAWGEKEPYPLISGYGKVTPVPNGALMPQPKATYRIVFDATRAGKKPSDVSESLQKVARAVNLFANAGVAGENIGVAVVLHSEATFATLSNAAYRAKFGRSNPNENLLTQLKKHGVQLYVCGQALAERGLSPQDVAESVRTAQAALTAVAELQRRGYSLQAL